MIGRRAWATARRLAKLADAPFIVEATKFTEVGFVGKDVDHQDLVEVGLTMARTKAMAKVKEAVREGGERLLDALVGAAHINHNRGRALLREATSTTRRGRGARAPARTRRTGRLR